MGHDTPQFIIVKRTSSTTITGKRVVVFPSSIRKCSHSFVSVFNMNSGSQCCVVGRRTHACSSDIIQRTPINVAAAVESCMSTVVIVTILLDVPPVLSCVAIHFVGRARNKMIIDFASYRLFSTAACCCCVRSIYFSQIRLQPQHNSVHPLAVPSLLPAQLILPYLCCTYTAHCGHMQSSGRHQPAAVNPLLYAM